MEQRLAADRATHIYGAAKGTGGTGKERINSGALLRRLLRYLTPFRLPLLGALGLVVITALVQAAGPVVIARAIDVNIAGKDLRGLALSMLLLLGICFMAASMDDGSRHWQIFFEAALFSWLSMLVSTYIFAQLLYRLLSSSLAAPVRLSWAFSRTADSVSFMPIV